jgi:hypothetical protein
MTVYFVTDTGWRSRAGGGWHGVHAYTVTPMLLGCRAGPWWSCMWWLLSSHVSWSAPGWGPMGWTTQEALAAEGCLSRVGGVALGCRGGEETGAGCQPTCWQRAGAGRASTPSSAPPGACSWWACEVGIVASAAAAAAGIGKGATSTIYWSYHRWPLTPLKPP